MPDANELVDTLKRAAVEAVEAGKPVNVYFGEVVSASPLKINVEQKMILGEKQLILSRNVTDFSTSASPVSIEVKTTVTFEEGHNWSNTKAAIAEAVDVYFLELRKNWSETSQTIVRVSQIENRILGVDGVVDVTGTKLNGTASNMTLTEFCIPKLGGVSA